MNTKYDYSILDIGYKIHNLTVIGKPYKEKNWLYIDAQCDCSKIARFRACEFIQGLKVSCGCVGKENRSKSATKHGRSNTRLYNIWHGMKQRCYNPKANWYCNYGGRGIEVCEEWRDSADIFIKWAESNGYEDHLTIERIDNNQGYFPQNCKWATKHEQERNMRKNRFFTAFGETRCFKDWSRDGRCLVKYTTLHSRVNEKGWEMEKALTTPRKEL